MRRKQLFAIILAGALAAGSAPAAVFAAESDMAAMSEEGVGNADSEEAGSEDGSSDAEAPVTDGADAADAATDTPAADNTTTDETPAADNTGAAETPAAEDPATADTTLPEEVQTQEQTEENKEVDPQESESTESVEEDTGIVLIDAESQMPATNADGKVVYYKTLQEAVDAVEAYSETNPDATTIRITKPVVLDKTIEITGKKVSIQAAAAGVTISRKTEGEAFTGTMFSVTGENSWLQLFADCTADTTLTVSGKCSEDGAVSAAGTIVDISDNAGFGLNPKVTLTENDYAAGGAAINCNNGKIAFAGGTVTGNTVGTKGAVYSNTDVSIEGDTSITRNDGDKNIVLDGTAKLVVKKALTGKSSFSHTGEKAGLEVIKADEGVSKDDFTASVKNISYENSSKYEYSTASDGLSVLLKEVTKVPDSGDEQKNYTLTYNKNTLKWTSHTTVTADYTVTGNCECEWTYFFIDAKTGDAVATYKAMKDKLKFTSVTASATGAKFTVTAKNVPEEDSKLIVLTRKNSSDKHPKAVSHSLKASSAIGKKRPPKETNNNKDNTNTQKARTHKVTEGTVSGLEGSIKFFPGKVYTFTPKGGGQDDASPYVTGDERWVPAYWTFSISTEAERHTKWQISAPKGQQLKGRGSVTYTMYIYCTKEVYNGKNWEATDVVEPYKAKFTAVEYTDKELADYLAELSGTPAQDDADGGDGRDGSGGDGGTDAELTATAAASAKDAGSKSKSAVSTADESPIGTMSVLAALSLLAGGYVVVRKRKKEEI